MSKDYNEIALEKISESESKREAKEELMELRDELKQDRERRVEEAEKALREGGVDPEDFELKCRVNRGRLTATELAIKKITRMQQTELVRKRKKLEEKAEKGELEKEDLEEFRDSYREMMGDISEEIDNLDFKVVDE